MATKQGTKSHSGTSSGKKKSTSSHSGAARSVSSRSGGSTHKTRTGSPSSSHHRSTAYRTPASGTGKKKRSSRRRRRAIRRLVILLALLVLLIVVAVFGGIYLHGKSALHESVVVEAGSRVTAQDFAKDPEREVSFVGLEEGQKYETETPGEYTVRVKCGLFSYPCKLIIVDTVPPELDVQGVTYYGEKEVTPEDFVVSVSDRTEVTLSFVTQPVATLEGEQTVNIRATDESGNETVEPATLTLIVDNDPPVLEGVRELFAYVNETVSYKEHVVVSDVLDPEASYEVDASAVDMTTVGTYPVIYTASDRAGNKTSVETKLTVMQRLYDEAKIRQAAQDVLNRIITDNMSEREKLTAIYTWCRSNIGYVNMTDDGDWMKAAYTGFTNHQGDCFVYCAVAKTLLDEAGIKNTIIGKIPNATDNTKHFWNLVDIGDGWYHFDTTPRRAGGDFNYIDDATLMAYSAAHDQSHNYDRSQYPGIK